MAIHKVAAVILCSSLIFVDPLSEGAEGGTSSFLKVGSHLHFGTRREVIGRHLQKSKCQPAVTFSSLIRAAHLDTLAVLPR